MTTHQADELLKRITVKEGVLNGKYIIRNMRFPVSDILEMLAGGMSPQQIVDEHPALELEDVQAALLFASAMMNNSFKVHAA